MTKKPKLISSIRAKLISAVAMLLVAVIMVVSSTYAWFTLSTAPEVTGISTQIGANGALEMALLPASGVLTDITSSAGDSSKDIEIRNVTWGNLVALSDNDIYGLDKIIMYPSQLNIAEGFIQASPVQIPTYGPDGRVDVLALDKTMASVYDTTEKNFFASNTSSFGVRAIGAASGMTTLQLSNRNARSQAANAMGAATRVAAQTLNEKGSALANIAIKYGMSGADAKFNGDDVAALRALIDGLQGTTDAEGNVLTEGAVSSIEKAYKLYIAAFATSFVSQEAGVTETQAMLIFNNAVDSATTLDALVAMLSGNGVTLSSGLQDRINRLIGTDGTRAAVQEADDALKILEDKLADGSATEFSWNDISKAMTPLAATDAMVINGFKASEVKNNLGALVSSVTANGGLVVSMGTGAGVFADIADHCGDYDAFVTIDRVEYNGIVLENMTAKMKTESTVDPAYLAVTGTEATAAGAPTGKTSEAQPLTEFYGYVVDMAFRTNAAESNLLLQTEAIDRIYGEDNNNDETMGHGSSMTYSSEDDSFTPEKIAALMSNIRIVFFAPTTSGNANLGKVLAYAKLDMTKQSAGVDGVTAPIVLYKAVENAFSYTDAEGKTAVCYLNDEDGKHYADEYFTQEITAPAEKTEIKEVQLTGKDAVITSLTQNTAVAVSVMVYLDGTNITNADVSATGTTSLTGSMNLQFASSAKLVPMENGTLHTPGEGAEGAGAEGAGS